MELSATRVRALKRPGRYSDDGGLHLFISKSRRKSWVLRITIDGRRRDIGLGGYPTVSLAQARDKAGNYRAAVAEGRDPLAEERAPAMPTFRGKPPSTVQDADRPRWRNARHIASWMQTLERHAMATLGSKPLDRIDRACRAASPHPDLDHPAGDGPAGAPADEDGLPVGDGARLYGHQPGG